MDVKQIVMLALRVSIMCTVFGFGLKTTGGDLLYLVRRPGLLVRSLLAVFVIMPLVVVALVMMFHFQPTVEAVLIALAISPVPPLLPGKQTKAGGHGSYGLGLMAILSVLSMVMVPLSLEILERIFGRELGMAPGQIAQVIVKGALAPLLAGIAVRAVLPAVARWLERPMSLVGKVLLPLAALALIIGALSAIWALVGDGTVLALVIFTVTGLAIGHLLGRPDPEHSVVLALSTACRHPAIAYSIVAANFPDQKFGAIILLYLIVSAIAGIPYLKWQQRPSHGAVPAS